MTRPTGLSFFSRCACFVLRFHIKYKFQSALIAPAGFRHFFIPPRRADGGRQIDGCRPIAAVIKYLPREQLVWTGPALRRRRPDDFPTDLTPTPPPIVAAIGGEWVGGRPEARPARAELLDPGGRDLT